MKIGVIIPTTGTNEYEDVATLQSVHAVCGGFDYITVTVYDGFGDMNHVAPYLTPNEHGIVLPECARDAGATPRTVGSAYALGQGCDVIAFLDSGNTYQPRHIRNAIELIECGAEVVSSLRTMISHTGEPMYTDANDSDGVKFADTNTIVLGGRAAKFATTWNWNASASGADRLLWSRLCHSFKGHMECTQQPTVHYSTRWACHYNPVRNDDGSPKFTPPDPAKWPIMDSTGKRAAMLARPIWDLEKGWIADLATATVNGERICVDVPSRSQPGLDDSTLTIVTPTEQVS